MKSIRGFLYIVTILCFTFSTEAQMIREGTLSGYQEPNDDGMFLIYDQTANWDGSLSTAQDFESIYDAYDAEGADDFVLPQGNWCVGSAVIISGYWNGSGPAESIHVRIYDDANGIPGAARCSYMNNGYHDDGAGNYFISFPYCCDLPPGTYWFSAQGQMDFAVGGQFGWGTESIQRGAQGVWRNPGNGFGSSCSTWTARGYCGYTSPDYSFRLYDGRGDPGPTPTVPAPHQHPIPTINRYGVIIMVLLLLGIAVFVVSRHR